MTLEPYEYRDPGQVVTDVTSRRSLRSGDVLLALVREPCGDQEVVQVRRLARSRWRDLDGYGRSGLLAETVRRMRVPEWDAGASPRHSIMTIVARRGLAVVGPAEAEWLIAWRYSNHLAHTFSGDLVVVTEHGWTDFMTGWGDRQPRLTAECLP